MPVLSPFNGGSGLRPAAVDSYVGYRTVGVVYEGPPTAMPTAAFSAVATAWIFLDSCVHPAPQRTFPRRCRQI